MNFEFGGERQEIRDRAAAFADREVAPHAVDLDREDRFPAEIFEKLSGAASEIQKLVISRSILENLAPQEVESGLHA